MNGQLLAHARPADRLFHLKGDGNAGHFIGSGRPFRLHRRDLPAEDDSRPLRELSQVQRETHRRGRPHFGLERKN